MSSPRFYYNDGRGSEGDDKAGNYADSVGHVLHFEDVRNENVEENFVTFIAFLTSFSQAFSSNWNAEEVYGRMDPIATFKNTTRTISVAWDIPAKNLAAARDNLQRCNQLISMLYPSYTRQNTETNALAMSKPPLIRMKFANLIQSNDGSGLLGYISSVNWNPVIEMGYFHLQRGPEGPRGGMYPKVIQVSVEFQAIHSDPLGWKEGKFLASGEDNKKHRVNWPFKDKKG